MTTLFFECEDYLKTKLYKPVSREVTYTAIDPVLPWVKHLDGSITVNTAYDNSENYSKHSYLGHLRYGYGKQPVFGLPELPFSEVVGTPSPDRGTWHQENVRNAVHIKQTYGDVALCLSGGLDSELMVATFLDAQVDFIACFMLYLGVDGAVLNEYDYHYTKRFCNTHDIPLLIEPVNLIDDLINERHLDYYVDGIEETKFLLPSLYTQAHIVSLLNARGLMPVMGSDQVEIKLDHNRRPAIGESLFSIGLACPTWAHRTNHDVIYDFFMYSPDAVYAYFDLPEVRNATTVDYNFKATVAHKYGSQRLGPRREKSTGYEQIGYEMKKTGHDFHGITMKNIDRVDWTKRPMTQYVHNLEHVLANSAYCDWQILRTTTHDFFCRGFKENDTEYFNI